MLPLVVIIGPTAVGKTKIAVDLALKMNGEIISGDSMQVYRGMDIGTAKIKPEETKGIVHHLIDICNPDEPFSAADFQKLAREKIKEISQKGKLPFLVGGTGFYIDAVLYPYQFTGQGDILPYRRYYYSLAKQKGKEYVHQLLKKIDPQAARKIHPHDLKRVSRALEYYQATNGKLISEKKDTAKQKPLYHAVMLGLSMERNLLYQNIEKRVDKMMANGFLEEVAALLKQGYSPKLTALQGLGYRQLIQYYQGEINLNTAIELIKLDTLRFAKRQWTWFKRNKAIKWFDIKAPDVKTQILAYLSRTLSLGAE